MYFQDFQYISRTFHVFIYLGSPNSRPIPRLTCPLGVGTSVEKVIWELERKTSFHVFPGFSMSFQLPIYSPSNLPFGVGTSVEQIIWELERNYLSVYFQDFPCLSRNGCLRFAIWIGEPGCKEKNTHT